MIPREARRQRTVWLSWRAGIVLAGMAAAGSSLTAFEGKESARTTKAAFVVQPYLQLPTRTGMTVMWETNLSLPGQVEFGTAMKPDRLAEATASSTLHEVGLAGLQPGTAYFYRVRSGPLLSETRRFKTAPPRGTTKWRMAVYGDSRSNPAEHRKVVEQIARANVDLILHTGDIVRDGRDHDSWRKEFFEPLAPIVGSVPWVSTIGNHERDSANYFSYMALPGNKHYFGFDYANAHLVCLDSNAWIAKGRDSEQLKWLASDLKEKHEGDWVFVAFHHPLFSGHASRPINPLRWDWAPVLLDPASHVDGILTGHDHFYARNYRMGFSSDAPQPGVFFLTTAGGGAPLYPVKLRDYVAFERVVHHFTLFEFDGDKVTITPIDRDGNGFDRYVLTRKPTPPDQFCAFEVEQLREWLRVGLAALRPIVLSNDKATVIDARLTVPTRFQHPIAGKLHWSVPAGWHLERTEIAFNLQPKQLLEIPLQATVDPGPFQETPGLTIEFAEGHFRNRKIELHPFKLGGPEQVAVRAIAKDAFRVGRSSPWDRATSYSLLSAPPGNARADRVRLLADPDLLRVWADLESPARPAKPGSDRSSNANGLLTTEHVRVVLRSGKETWSFTSSPDETASCLHNGKSDRSMHGGMSVRKTPTGWSMDLWIPGEDLGTEPRINVVHHIPGWLDGRSEPRPSDKTPARTKAAPGAPGLSTLWQPVDFVLCPVYVLSGDPDRIPDWKSEGSTEGSARLLLP